MIQPAGGMGQKGRAIEDLKSQIKAAPISAIVGNYITLHRRGTSVTALCPFHSDKKPSLSVSDKKGLYRCFACNVGGDAITFVQRFKSLDFIESLRECSRILGLNSDALDQDYKVDPELLLAKKILQKATLIYRKIANEGPHPVFKEFLEKRGLSAQISEQFQLGFAPHNSIITKYLQSIPDAKEREQAMKMALKIELIKEDQNRPGHYFDKFRDRIMFPIWDQFGHVQGFTARAIRDDQQPKYLNSNESFVFSKKNLLYGLHFAKPIIRERDQLILAEGNMDVIALFQFGFTQSVAIMGTAINENGLSFLKGLTKNVWLALDSDGPGLVAAQRTANLFHKIGIIPKFLDFSPHKDPDDFLKAEGALMLQKRLDEAPTFIDSILEKSLPAKKPELIEQKQALLQKSFALLSSLGDSLDATERLIWFSQKIGLKSDAQMIQKEYQTFLKSEGSKYPANSLPSNYKTAPSEEIIENKIEIPMEQNNESSYEATPIAAPEKILRGHHTLLRLLLEHPHCLAKEKLHLVLDLLENNEVKQYVASLKNLYFEVEESEFADMALALLSQERWSISFKEIVGGILFNLAPKSSKNVLEDSIAERLIKDLAYHLEIEQIKEKRNAMKGRQLQNETLEDSQRLLEELNIVQKKIGQLNKLNKQRRKTSSKEKEN